MSMPFDPLNFLNECGYADFGVTTDNIKALDDGTYVLAKPLMFHWTLIRGDQTDTYGYFDRWCYADERLAMAALRAFPLDPPDGYEPAGWHKHPATGRTRPAGDPDREFR